MLGADVGVHQALGFFLGKLEYALGLVAERDLDGGREFLAPRAPTLELGLKQIHRHVGAGEQLARRVLAFLEQAEQQMLGADLLRALLAGLVARQKEDSFGLFREFLEHRGGTLARRKSVQTIA